MITPKEIQDWQRSVNAFGRPIRGTEMASMIGVRPETYCRWRNKGVSDDREKLIRYAMAAVSAGLTPWAEKQEK